MAKKLTNKELDRLHDKFVKGTISRDEKRILYDQYSSMFTNSKGRVNYGELDEFLTVTHKDYGKPGKDGITEIV